MIKSEEIVAAIEKRYNTQISSLIGFTYPDGKTELISSTQLDYDLHITFISQDRLDNVNKSYRKQLPASETFAQPIESIEHGVELYHQISKKSEQIDTFKFDELNPAETLYFHVLKTFRMKS